MRYFIGTTSRNWFESVCTPGLEFGMILAPGRAWRSPYSVYACDNNVFANWQKGLCWNDTMERDWLAMLDKIARMFVSPEWVLLPDAVGDWPRTLDMAHRYLPELRARGFPVAIALQDGCSLAEALGLGPQTLFVGGTTAWKEAILPTVSDAALRAGCRVHVGRVNTARRLRLCQAAGVAGVDGTALNRWRGKHLAMIHKTLRQPCLHL